MSIDESMQSVAIWMALTKRGIIAAEWAAELKFQISCLGIILSMVQQKSLKNFLCEVQGY